MILFTEEFPFGNGETFLENEIPYLGEYFDVTIVSASKSAEQTRNAGTEQIFRLRPEPYVKGAGYVKSLISFLLRPQCLKELLLCVLSFKSVKKRCAQAVNYYLKGLSFYEGFKKLGIIEPGRRTVLYFYWNDYKPLLFLMNGRRLKNTLMISRIHGTDFYNERISTGRQAFKRLNRKLDILALLSETAKEYYVKNLDRHCCNAVVAPLGVINDFGPAPYAKGDVFRLCSCSRVVGLKRLELIIESLALISDFEVEWSHFGDGDDMPKIMALALEKLGSKPNIKYQMTGFLSYSQLHGNYRTHSYDCFILTSETEGVPVSIMEVLSYGIPVIATSVGGIPEMLSGSGNIILVPNPAPAEITAALKKIIELPGDKAKALREENISIWRGRYDAGKNYRCFAEAVCSLSEEKRENG
jgi:glycosyltransferase involved in cell wall biosynthesis